jgi:hypothetical protein
MASRLARVNPVTVNEVLDGHVKLRCRSRPLAVPWMRIRYSLQCPQKTSSSGLR